MVFFQLIAGKPHLIEPSDVVELRGPLLLPQAMEAAGTEALLRRKEVKSCPTSLWLLDQPPMDEFQALGNDTL